MSNPHKVTLLTSSDWQAVYIDDVREVERSILSPQDWLDVIGELHSYSVTETYDVDEGLVENVWGYEFPELLTEEIIEEIEDMNRA